MTEILAKKPRTRKVTSASQLMNNLKGQPLAIKVELSKLLRQSIEDDGKILKEQLALIGDAGK